MRAVLYALMITLWFSATPAAARNGETGILIMVQTFEFVEGANHQTTLLLCSDDVVKISNLLEEGYDTSILLPGYGIFTVAATPTGEVKLMQQNIEIQARECHPRLDGPC